MNRRKLIQSLGISALAISLNNVVDVWASESKTSQDVSKWLDKLYGISMRLKNREVSSLQWQETMDLIYGSAPIEDLKKRLSFDALRKVILEEIPADRGELFHRVELPGSSLPRTADGREPHRVLITKVAHIKKGRSIPPHGHSNMASAFLCLSGEFEVRQYDRLEDQEEYMIVRQTVHQKKAIAGDWSSISDYRNNVHWLTAKTNDCYLFTSKLINLEQHRPLKGRVNIDIHRSITLGTNTFKASKITSKEAAELY